MTGCGRLEGDPFAASSQSRLLHGLGTRLEECATHRRTRSRSCDSGGGSRMQPKVRFSVGGALLSSDERSAHLGKESGDLEGVDVRLLGPASCAAGTAGGGGGTGGAAGDDTAEMRMFQCSVKRSSRFTTSVPATDVLTRIQEVVESDVNPLPTPVLGCTRKVGVWVCACALHG